MHSSSLPSDETALTLGFDRLAAPFDPGARRRTEEIRWRMIHEAGDADADSKSLLMHRVIFSDDPQLLWDLRSELFGILVKVRGATDANRRLARITSLFAGLPPGLGLLKNP
jgi:hypothetical protein